VNPPNRAIILAAGQGKRLLPLTESRPKCLIELSGRSLLAWQLIRLQAAGVEEAVVVTGFRADAVEAEIARRHGADPAFREAEEQSRRVARLLSDGALRGWLGVAVAGR
jgi:NDP-sugar pyrophosphorylase family protein